MALISVGKSFFKYSTGTNKIPIFQSWKLLQKANLSGKILRSSDPVTEEKPKPFPYRVKKLRAYHQLFDRTSARFDENTKIIVVDGPPAAGKTAVAKALAEEFDMLYVPETNMDLIYINSYGVNIRDYNHLFPKSAKTFDICNFFSDPKCPEATNFQVEMFRLRYAQYLLALRHLFNTGQGIVFDRCVYCDSVFLETMYKFGYINKNARSYYYDTQIACLPEILRPHLVVYLDVPVNECRKRIIARKYGDEAKTFTSEYLQTLENFYKQDYLKNISTHAELLIYDWSNLGEVESIVEDIERVDFDKYDRNDGKLKDWFFGTETSLFERRLRYTADLRLLNSFALIPRFDVPEVLMSGEDSRQYEAAWDSIPGNKFAPGYNKEMGDKYVFKLLKSHLPEFP